MKVWKEKRINQPMARFDHYRFICADCGQVSNLTRSDRAKHWFTCKLIQSVLGGFRSASTVILRGNDAKRRS